MTLDELSNLLKSTGLRVKEYQYKKPPTLPYVLYYAPDEHHYGSDSKNLITKQSVEIELYSEKRDYISENKLESVLSGIEFSKNVDFIESDQFWIVTYSLDLYSKIK